MGMVSNCITNVASGRVPEMIETCQTDFPAPPEFKAEMLLNTHQSAKEDSQRSSKIEYIGKFQLLP